MGGRYLTLQNRLEIDRYLREGISVRRIADPLRVSHTTVSRELQSRCVFALETDRQEEPSACVRCVLSSLQPARLWPGAAAPSRPA